MDLRGRGEKNEACWIRETLLYFLLEGTLIHICDPSVRPAFSDSFVFFSLSAVVFYKVSRLTLVINILMRYHEHSRTRCGGAQESLTSATSVLSSGNTEDLNHLQLIFQRKCLINVFNCKQCKLFGQEQCTERRLVILFSPVFKGLRPGISAFIQFQRQFEFSTGLNFHHSSV